jgi:acyl-CoA reductase-like NAD-dependent aldehyde dehydrogenase
MNVTNPATGKPWTAGELRKLPPAERDAIMEAAAALAEEEYRNNPELTAFEAFGKDDLYGESASTQTR